MIVNRLDRKFLAIRSWSNRVLRDIAPRFSGEVVNVSGWKDSDKLGGRYQEYFTSATAYFRTNYFGHSGFQGDAGEIPLDLTEPLPENLRRRFDVVFNHTTLEHIFEVRRAFANLCEMSRDAVIVVVPFSQVQHESESYGDYWRLSPTCLRQLFAENGLTVVYEAESPIRNASIYLLFVGSRDPGRYQGELPPLRKIGTAGRWIGASAIVSVVQFANHRLKRALGVKADE